ncbi:hypothetical protein JKF63_04812 [Porcisia hertigi]|uniref:Uncharacterized protein n=1 Tax=Porcisia hertigi TaxID=2761500 RepID=A0A836IMU2_9TRYP|nr:hypothetical protein JKF63_04812 [Porcisia hertigi]
MTASSIELEKLKRELIVKHEDQLNLELAARAGAEGEGTVPTPSAVASYLHQQLLCLRAGRPYGARIPTSASETVQLLAEIQPPPKVMLMQRMHKTQNESIRLLSVHAAATAASATIPESSERVAAAEAPPPPPTADDVTVVAAAHEEVAIKPFTGEERMALLSKLAHGSPFPALAQSVEPTPAPAAATLIVDDIAKDECQAEASGDQRAAENQAQEEAVEENQEIPAGLTA